MRCLAILIGVLILSFDSGSMRAQQQSASSALIDAVRTSSLDRARELLAKGADANVTDAKGLPVLSIAAETCVSPLVEALLGAGGKVNARDRSGGTALLRGIERGCDAYLDPFSKFPERRPEPLRIPSVAEVLVDHGADVNVKNKAGMTPLLLALTVPSINAWISGPRLGVVNSLIAAGADANLTDKQGRTPLMFAASPQLGSHKLDLVNALLAAGADMNVADNDGRTALMFVVSHKAVRHDQVDLDVIGALLTAGAHVNAVDNSGQTALFHAAAIPELSVLRALLNAGADPNIKDSRGLTPLMHLRSIGSIRSNESLQSWTLEEVREAIRVLISAGAKP